MPQYFKQSQRQHSKPPSSRSTKSNQPRKSIYDTPSTENSRAKSVRLPSSPRPTFSRRDLQSRSSNANESLPEVNPPVDEDEVGHIIMAIDKIGKSTLGCAYYVVREGVLRCMEDIRDPEECIFENLKLDIQPTIILISPRSGSILDSEQTVNNAADINVLPYKFEMRPSADFKYEQAVRKLADMSTLDAVPGVRFLVPGGDEIWNEGERFDEIGLNDERGQALHLSSMVNLEARISIGCAGAIFSYVQRRVSSQFLHDDRSVGGVDRISKLEMFSLDKTMLVNADTLATLQILQPESHPSFVRQGLGTSSSKESLSVYGLFHRFARTPQGKTRLRQMFLRPCLDMRLIARRHNSISSFARNDNALTIQSMSKSLGKIKDMQKIVTMLHRGIEGGTIKTTGVKSGVWSSLLDFCCHIIEISGALQEINDRSSVSIGNQLMEAFNRAEFQELGKIMYNVVDVEESYVQRRTVVKRGIDQELDNIKDAYSGMDEILQRKATETIHDLQSSGSPPAPDLTVMYIPQMGYLVQLPIAVAETLIQAHSPCGWDRSFITETHSYFKTNLMREMDEDLGDLWSAICDREIDISYRLAQKVLEKEQLLTRASELCGELDCLLALAHGATQYKLRRPRMVDDNIIDIRGGRHLLQELIVTSYIANDTLVSGGVNDDDDVVSDGGSTNSHHEMPSMLLLTGPNYSGKSVYLKQVALIVYMAQVGSFVPAQYARLGLTDKILTRVTARETVSRGQSSFMIDLQQMAWAVNTFTPRSLLVVDEFGKGTDNFDGAGLMAGFIKYVSSLGSKAPKTIACTHFHEIFEHRFISEHEPGLKLLQMEVYISGHHRASNQSESTSSEEVTYLYKVQPGRSTLSYGTQCAAMNGIPERVVAHADQLTEAMLRGDDLVSACSVIPIAEYKELEEAEVVSRAFLDLELFNLDIETSSTRLLLSDIFANVVSESPG